MNALKGTGAVLAGFVAVVVLALCTDKVLMMTGVFPDPVQHPELYSDGMYALITFYTAVFSAAGAWLTAWLAPSRPITHALVLGALGAFFSTLGAIVQWKLAAGHEWYPIALIVIAIPSCWLGGWFYMRGKSKAA